MKTTDIISDDLGIDIDKVKTLISNVEKHGVYDQLGNPYYKVKAQVYKQELSETFSTDLLAVIDILEANAGLATLVGFEQEKVS